MYNIQITVLKQFAFFIANVVITHIAYLVVKFVKNTEYVQQCVTKLINLIISFFCIIPFHQFYNLAHKGTGRDPSHLCVSQYVTCDYTVLHDVTVDAK